MGIFEQERFKRDDKDKGNIFTLSTLKIVINLEINLVTVIIKGEHKGTKQFYVENIDKIPKG